MLAHDILRSDDRRFTPTSSSKSAWYLLVLVLAKFLKCIGIFFTDILLKSSHVVCLLWAQKLISACLLIPIQKPFSHGKSLRRHLVLRIGRMALMNCLIEIAWLYALTLCGPLRCILIFEMSPSLIMVGLVAFFKGNGSPAKTRGIVCIVVGLIVLLLLDRDETMLDPHSSTHAHHSGLNHIFYHVVSMLGVADHQGGILLLILLLLLRIGLLRYESSFRHLAVEIGGGKRLHSLLSLFSAFLLIPVAVLIYFVGSTQSLIPIAFSTYLYLLVLSTIFVFILDFYAEHVCFQHVADPVMSSARWSPVTMFVCSLVVVWLYYPSGGSLPPSGEGSHPLTGGVLFSLVSFSLACLWLTADGGKGKSAAHFVGLSQSGVPLYNYGEAFLQKTSRSMLIFFKETLREILVNSDSRKIFWFLLVNLSFCGVEFAYGFWTNSLGLISDAFHMLFDCSALVMGLVASVMSRWPATKHYSYGFGRVEVLSGFINALFLNVIATFILMEAWGRIWDPPKVNTDRLLIVAVAGLIVNLFGMFSLHGEGHGHSHGGGSHGHSHGGGNANMQGVFLHVLADTLGSVFVIISSLLLDHFGWEWVDPLCSFILSLLILGSAYPLLKSSSFTLLQDIPSDLLDEWEYHVEEILTIPGVVSFSQAHCWQLKSGLNVASIHVQVDKQANAQTVRHKVLALLKEAGATQSSVQVEREEFDVRMSQSRSSWSGGEKTTKANCIPRERSHNHTHSHGHGHSH